MRDMEMHYQEFLDGQSFTYSILDGDEVIGCVYIYPVASDPSGADIRSWVRTSRSEMDKVVWRSLSVWFEEQWPFTSVRYASRS